jgi:hypothetical protein
MSSIGLVGFRVSEKILMARPSAASLNSLVEVLRLAQPLYDDCRLILNHLDHGEAKGLPVSGRWSKKDSKRRFGQ